DDLHLGLPTVEREGPIAFVELAPLRLALHEGRHGRARGIERCRRRLERLPVAVEGRSRSRRELQGFVLEQAAGLACAVTALDSPMPEAVEDFPEEPIPDLSVVVLLAVQSVDAD